MIEAKSTVNISNSINKKVPFGATPVEKKFKPDPLNDQKVNLNAIDTVGWVFSGGGAKGVFEAGVACALAKAGMLPDVIVGTSVGALNAAALSNGDVDKACKVWQDVSKDKVYKSKVGKIILRSFGQVANWLGLKKISGIRSFLDNTPLRETVRENIDYNEIFDNPDKYPEVMFGVTALNNGREGLYATPKLYNELKSKDDYGKDGVYKVFELTPKNFEDAVVASTSIPLAFPAVQIDDEVFVDGGTGNNTPAKNGIDALFALNKDLREGLLFVVMLSPPEEGIREEDKLTYKDADIGKVGVKTLNIMLDNAAKSDVKITQKITKEIERWDVINIQVQDALEKIAETAVNVKEKAADLLKLAKLLPDNEAEKIEKIAEELNSLSDENIEDTEVLSGIVGKYKPFNGKKKIKVVIVRPNESFGVDTLEFDKAGKNADSIIRMGYDSTLNALYQTGIINREKYNTLMQDNPTPAGNMFEKKELSKVG